MDEGNSDQSVTVAKAGVRVTITFAHSHHSQTFMRFMTQIVHSLLDQTLSNIASLNGHSRTIEPRRSPISHVVELDE